MSLKQVVGCMILLGLASPIVASARMNAGEQAQFDSLRAQVAKMEAAMLQNHPGGFESYCGWADRISISGQINVDAAFANRSPVFQRGFFGTDPTFTGRGRNRRSVSDIFVNNANLYIDAKASDWTTAHIGFAYGTTTPNFVRLTPGAGGKLHVGTFVVENSHNINFDLLDEAYVNIANFAKSPFFFKAGKQFLPFGDYVPYADITPSFTQLLSQTRAVSANVGFVDCSGFSGSIFAYHETLRRRERNASTFFFSDVNDRHRVQIRDWGADLNFAQGTCDWGYKLGVSWIRNIATTDYISSTTYTTGALTLFGLPPVSNFVFERYEHTVGGLAANASGRFGAFDGSIKYAGAMKRFAITDVATRHRHNNDTVTRIRGAKPQAWGVDVGYTFPVMCHQSRFGIGYQATTQADLLGQADGTLSPRAAGLPKSRWLADYAVNISRYTDLGLQVRNDRFYSGRRFVTDPVFVDVDSDGIDDRRDRRGRRNATVGTIRLSVKFA